MPFLFCGFRQRGGIRIIPPCARCYLPLASLGAETVRATGVLRSFHLGHLGCKI